MINFNQWMHDHEQMSPEREALSLNELSVEELFERALSDRDALTEEQYLSQYRGDKPDYQGYRNLMERSIQSIMVTGGEEGLRALVRYAHFKRLDLQRTLELDGQELTLQLHCPGDDREVWFLDFRASLELTQRLEVAFMRCELLSYEQKRYLDCSGEAEVPSEWVTIAFRPQPLSGHGGHLRITGAGCEERLSWGPLRRDGLFEMTALCGGKGLARVGYELDDEPEPEW